MSKQMDQCSQWSSSENQKQINVFTTLSQNLQKYQQLQKHYVRHHKAYRISKPIISERFTKEITNEQQNDLDKQNQYHQEYLMNADLNHQCQKFSKNNQSKKPQQIRLLHSKSENRNRQELKPLKLREVKFEHKNRKKAKDRWVDIFTQMKGQKRISLKKIDDINKQNKQQKIQLFLKLLKR